jgi:hypothetical protein
MVGVYLFGLGLILWGACAAAVAVGRRIWPLGATARVYLAVRNRTLAVVICGLGLASCSSFAMPGFDAFKPKPTTTLLLIQSTPAGAEARTSLGQTCRTPCTMRIGAAEDFTVSFTLNGYVPQTLTVHSTMSEGGFMTAASPTLTPASLFATLESATPQAQKPPRQRPRPAATGAGAQQ